MRGRKPKDEALKAASGNPGRRSHPNREAIQDPPASPQDAFAPPRHLRRAARSVWQREVWRLREQGLSRASDLALFGDYCGHQALVERCDAALEQSLTYETVSKHGSMTRARPEYDMRVKAARLAQQCLQQLGLTTLSRLRARQISGQLNLPLSTPASAPAQAPAKTDSAVGFLN
jgi:P27 family predicted phage terminase small subunit